MKTAFLRNAIVLGLLSAVGPFAIDMYLPSLPAIARSLEVGEGAAKLSLASFFVAVACCQVIYGPISDMVGRKAPLFFGLGLFLVGTLGCALAPSIEWLIIGRFVQGVGACASMIIPRAIVRDLHTGPDAARLMTFIMLVFSVSPILAPLSGSLIIRFFDWRLIFLVMAGAAVVAILLVAFALGETRPKEERIGSSFGAALKGYATLLRDRHFLGLVFIGGLGMASFFAFLGGSSFIYINHYGLSPTEYGLMFSMNAIAFIGVSQASATLARRFGFSAVVRAALLFYFLCVVLLFGLSVAGVDSLAVLAALLFLGFGGLGLVIPSTAVLALEDHGPIAGTAAALMGTLQMVCGALVIGIVSLFEGDSPLPMVTAIAVCGAGAYVLGRLTLKAAPHRVEAPAS